MTTPDPVPIGRGGLSAPPLGYGAASLGNLYQALSENEWPEIVAGGVVAASDISIPLRTTGWVSQNGGWVRACGCCLATSTSSRPKSGGCSCRRMPQGAPTTRISSPSPADHRRVRDYSRDGVLRSIESSLERLGLDRIDLVLVHDPDEYEHEREALDGAFPALSELRDQGVITSFGAGMNQSAMLARFVAATDADVMMVAGRWTLLDQSAADDLLPLALEREVSVISAAVFNSGILATDAPGAGDTFDYGPAARAVVERAQAIAAVAHRHGSTLPELAVQFPLTHPAVAAVVTGGASAAQAIRNSGLIDRPVADAVWDELRDRGLVGPSRMHARRPGTRVGQPVR